MRLDCQPIELFYLVTQLGNYSLGSTAISKKKFNRRNLFWKVFP